jgi:hypothetical protein
MKLSLSRITCSQITSLRASESPVPLSSVHLISFPFAPLSLCPPLPLSHTSPVLASHTFPLKHKPPPQCWGRGLVPTSSLHARFYLTSHPTTNPCVFKMAVTGMFGRHAHELHSAEASDDWKSLAHAEASAKRAVDRVLEMVRIHVHELYCSN